MVSENPNAEYLLWNGNRVQIKRERFERFVDTLRSVYKELHADRETGC